MFRWSRPDESTAPQRQPCRCREMTSGGPCAACQLQQYDVELAEQGMGDYFKGLKREEGEER
jgi:hypothetical protein